MLAGSMRHTFVISLLFLTVALQISMASAAERHRLAYSSSLGIEVFAWSDTGRWCQETVNLDIIARDGKFFDSSKFGGLVKKIGQIMQSECPAVQSANLKGFHGGNHTSILALGVTRKANWVVGRSISLDDPSPAKPLTRSSQPSSKPAPQSRAREHTAGAASDHIASQGIGTAANCSDARLAAYRDAVQRAVGIYIDSETVVKNYDLIKDKIINYSDGYIDSVEVISEQKTSGGLCIATIQAKVRSTKLQTKINEIKPQLTKVSNQKMVSIEATIQTEKEKRSGALEVLKKIVPKIPTSLFVQNVRKLREPTKREEKFIKFLKKKKNYEVARDHAVLIIELETKTNDQFLDKLFSAVKPFLREKTQRFPIGINNSSLELYQSAGRNTKPTNEDGFLGLTNSILQGSGRLEIGGVLDPDIYFWVGKMLSISLELEDCMYCDSGFYTAVTFYDKNNQPIFSKTLKIWGWNERPKFKGRNPSPNTYGDLKHLIWNRRKIAVGQFKASHSWLPYHIPRMYAKYANAFPVLSKRHSVVVNIPIHIPVSLLAEIRLVSADPSLSPSASKILGQFKGWEPKE